MSATKRVAKWVKSASVDDLHGARATLATSIGGERNLAVRSSLRGQLDSVEAELKRRGVGVPVGWDHV